MLSITQLNCKIACAGDYGPKQNRLIRILILIIGAKIECAAAMLGISLLLLGCGGSSSAGPGVPPPPPSDFVAQTTFTDVTTSTGISHVFSIIDANRTGDPTRMGGGLAAADIDNDGDVDLYFVGGDGAPNALYRNDGNNQFTDITAMANVGMIHLGSGPAFADIDGDGDLDLFVGSLEGDAYYLFRYDAGIYTDVTAISGLSISASNTVSAGFGDYDQDADLDLFLAHWGNRPQADTQTLWQNNGDGTFTSASIQSGLADQIVTQDPGLPGFFDYTFSPVLSDIDNDGDADLLFASDFETSKFFINDGNGTFTNATDRNVIVDRNGMGSVSGDYDNDGDMDWFVTSIFENDSFSNANIGNRLYRNTGNGGFEDATEEAGVADGGWGWAACMQDFDNDGDLDIFHVNGWNQVDPQDSSGSDEYAVDQIRYFESQGDGTFVFASTEARLTDTGQGRGATCFDSDRDGDIDIVLTNNSDSRSVVFYRNDLASANHYLGLRLKSGGLNTAAVGARIEVDDGNTVQIREISAGNNFASQGPAEAHFGLGTVQNVDVLVRWPDGSQSIMNNVTVDQAIEIAQP